MKKKIKILICEDQLLVAKLLEAKLKTEPDFDIVGIELTGERTLAFLKKTTCDILLLDIDLPGMDGIDVLNVLRVDFPNIKTMILSNHLEGKLISKAVHNGAISYLSKSAEIEELRISILKTLNNESYFDKEALQNLMAYMKNPNHNGDNSSHQNGKFDYAQVRTNYNQLTKREKEILILIINEKTSKQISETLFISARTVETHRKNILQKFGVKNSISLVKLLMEAGVKVEESIA